MIAPAAISILMGIVRAAHRPISNTRLDNNYELALSEEHPDIGGSFANSLGTPAHHSFVVLAAEGEEKRRAPPVG